jgi:hypothetical protein
MISFYLLTLIEQAVIYPGPGEPGIGPKGPRQFDGSSLRRVTKR